MMTVLLAVVSAAPTSVAAQEQKKTLRIAKGGTRVVTTRQLRGAEILEYGLAGVQVRQIKGNSFVSTIEEFDRDGLFLGANGSFLYRLQGGGSAVKTYVAPINKVSLRGTGTRRVAGVETEVVFDETASEQMERIDKAIRGINDVLSEELKITTNGFLVFMALAVEAAPSQSEQLAGQLALRANARADIANLVPARKELAAVADRATRIDAKEAALQLKGKSQDDVVEAFMQLLGVRSGGK
jgi:hypothetical protein